MATLRFYLVPTTAFTLDPDHFDRCVALMETGTWPLASGAFFLVAGFNSTAQHADASAAFGVLGNWTYTVDEARSFVRRNGLTHQWWLLDWFIAKCQEA